MPLLILDDDDIALLRFTCDLFFVPESPLCRFDRDPAEPGDTARSYDSLVARGVIDPTGFRITDEALNRLAPVTECDARLVHLIFDKAGEMVGEDNHWLLDEIAVVYEHEGDKHVFGPDLDHEQLIARLARRMVAGRPGAGPLTDITVSSSEWLAVAVVVAAAAEQQKRWFDDDALRAVLLRTASMTSEHPPRASLPRVRRDGVVDPRTLVERGALRHEGGVWVVPAPLMAIRQLDQATRHTVVRTDFRDDGNWRIRDVSFFVVDGGVWSIAPVRGGLRVRELDGDTLKEALKEAVGGVAVAGRIGPALR